LHIKKVPKLGQLPINGSNRFSNGCVSRGIPKLPAHMRRRIVQFRYGARNRGLHTDVLFESACTDHNPQQESATTMTATDPSRQTVSSKSNRLWTTSKTLSLVARRAAPAPVAEKETPSLQFQMALTELLPHLRRYAVSLCRDASFADDLVQETMMNALLAQHRFQVGTNLKAWCATILRNVFFSYKRRSWRVVPLADEAMLSIPAQSGGVSNALDLLALRNTIALLPTGQREALLLICVGGMSYESAAQVCDCKPGTVKSRVSRARERITALASENHVSFNSDAGLSSDKVMDDLLGQVAVIVSKAMKRQNTDNAKNEVPYKPSLPDLMNAC
jgi:RNA polymerase sigma-70 factor, ECF subfamily